MLHALTGACAEAGVVVSGECDYLFVCCDSFVYVLILTV